MTYTKTTRKNKNITERILSKVDWISARPLREYGGLKSQQNLDHISGLVLAVIYKIHFLSPSPSPSHHQRKYRYSAHYLNFYISSFVLHLVKLYLSSRRKMFGALLVRGPEGAPGLFEFDWNLFPGPAGRRWCVWVIFRSPWGMHVLVRYGSHVIEYVVRTLYTSSSCENTPWIR
jgi:hypothetical protein